MPRRVAILASGDHTRRALVLSLARQHGDSNIVELSSTAALVDAVRDGHIGLVIVGCMSDRGSPAVAIRALAAVATANARLVAIAQGITLESCQAILNAAAVLVEHQQRARVERLRAGRAEARARGVTFGRPAAVIDLSHARQLIKQGQSMRTVARAVGVSPKCLRKHLDDVDGQRGVGRPLTLGSTATLAAESA